MNRTARVHLDSGRQGRAGKHTGMRAGRPGGPMPPVSLTTGLNETTPCSKRSPAWHSISSIRHPNQNCCRSCDCEEGHPHLCRRQLLLEALLALLQVDCQGAVLGFQVRHDSLDLGRVAPVVCEESMTRRDGNKLRAAEEIRGWVIGGRLSISSWEV